MSPIGYRRQHEKALAKIVDRIVDLVLKKELDLQNEIDLTRALEDSIDKLSKIQDLSSRRYQVKQLKREIRHILEDSKNLLVATLVDRMNN